MTTNGSGVYSITANNSANWNTAYGWGDHSTQSYATQSYVGTQLANLVDSSPSTLDTLNELAAALGDDPNFATTTANSIGTKMPLAGGTFTGNVSLIASSAINLRVTDGTQNIYVGSSGNTRFGLGAGASIIQSTGASFGIGTQDGNSLILGTNNTAALTINTSQTATFAGFLTAKKLTSTDGVLELDDNGTHNGIINAPASLRINIDSDNNSTGEKFVVGYNQTNIDNNNELFVVEENGRATFAGIIICNNVGNDRKIEFNRTGANVYSIEHDSAFLYFYNVTTNSIPLKLANNNNATFGNSIFLPDNRDIGWNGGYSASKPTLAAVGTTMKMFPSGATSGAQFTLTPTTATFAGNIMPTAENTQNIGSASVRWEDLYVDDGYLRDAYIDEYIYHNGDPNTYIRFTDDTQTFRTGGDDRLILTNTTATFGGKVIIGAGGSTAKLNVGGKVKITDDLIMAQTNGRIDYDNGNSNGALRFFSTSANTEHMRINSAGNVGIHETAPAAKLQVSGDRDGNSEYVAILGEDGGANGAANSGNITPVHKTLLTGYSIPYSGQTNARLTSVGFLEFDSTPGWTGNQRNWALTSGYDMGGTNGPKFAILMGDAQNVEPQLGTNGAVGTGDGTNTRVAAYWKNSGDMVLPEGSLSINDGVYLGGTASANKLDDYEEGTWTPQIYYQNSTDQANATNTVSQGKYTKIGNLVFVQFRLDFSQSSSPPANDNIGVKNLPFAGANNHYAGGGNVITSDASSNGYNLALPNAGSTVVILNNSGNVGNYGDQFGSGSNKYIRGSFAYIAQ